MDSRTRKALSDVISTLEEAASLIRTLEAEAKEALYSADDIRTYREKLQEKVQLLMELPERTDELLDGMQGDIAREIGARMDDFARRAESAMGLSSLFYMSALLYPEDYKEGDKNDLERYIEDLRRRQK